MGGRRGGGDGRESRSLSVVTVATPWRVFCVWGCRWVTGLLFSRWSRHGGTPIHQGAMSCRPSEKGVEPPNTSDSAAESVKERSRERERFKNSSCVWLRRKKVLDRLLPVINSGDYRHRQSFWLSLLQFAYINCSDALSLNSWWTSLITHAHQTVKPSFHRVLWQRVSSSYRLKIINMSQNGDSTRDFITNLSEQMVWLVQDPSFTVSLDRTALNV